MCSNYRPAKPESLRRFGRELPLFAYAEESYPERVGPFLSNSDPSTWLLGTFGLLPHWAAPELARHTYNARTETVAEKASYRNAWKRRHLAVIPVEAFYEPCYETGKPVRWKIERADGEAFGLAGIWETRAHPNGGEWCSYSMLTINADEHPLMRRFHQPGKEKRSVVILADNEWEAWMSAKSEEEARSFLRPFDPDLFRAEAAPKPPRSRAAAQS